MNVNEAQIEDPDRRSKDPLRCRIKSDGMPSGTTVWVIADDGTEVKLACSRVEFVQDFHRDRGSGVATINLRIHECDLDLAAYCDLDIKDPPMLASIAMVCPGCQAEHQATSEVRRAANRYAVAQKERKEREACGVS